MSTIEKRSVVIAGKKTSISLEPEFWIEVQRLGRENGGIGNFVTGIKLGARTSNLSSALRIAVLTHLKRVAAESAARAILLESEPDTMRSGALG